MKPEKTFNHSRLIEAARRQFQSWPEAYIFTENEYVAIAGVLSAWLSLSLESDSQREIHRELIAQLLDETPENQLPLNFGGKNEPARISKENRG